MSKYYVIEMPDEWYPAKAINRNTILSNAKELVEIHADVEIEQWVQHHLENGEWVSRIEVNGKPVKLYAVEAKP